MATVYIPTPLRTFTQGQAVLQAVSNTIEQLFNDLEAQYPGLRSRLYNQQGGLNSYIAVFVNGQSINNLQQEATPLTERDEVYIIPAIAGG